MLHSTTSPFEANGAIVKGYFDAFRLVPHVPQNIFAKHGVGRILPSGEYEIDLTRYYPLDQVLNGLNEVVSIVSTRKAFEMGLEVVKNASVPPGATDIFSALKIFDAGYHLNHRRNGLPMFDPVTGKMLEGIGHYKYVSGADRSAIMEVDVAYPCDFDRGIMQAWAGRFQRGALVTHLEPDVCRKTGAPKCRYEITWK
jgi:hypothetical protein